MSELAIQAIGFVGVAFFIASYQIKSNRALFACQLTGCVIFCIQFFILGAYTGALSLMINILRNLLLFKVNDWKWVKSKVTLSVIIILLATVTIYTWVGWFSLLPFVSVTVTSIGYWTNNAQKIRLSQSYVLDGKRWEKRTPVFRNEQRSDHNWSSNGFKAEV